MSPTVDWVATNTTFHHIGPAQPGLGNTSVEIQVILACVRLTAEAKHPSLLTSLRSSFFCFSLGKAGYVDGTKQMCGHEGDISMTLPSGSKRRDHRCAEACRGGIYMACPENKGSQVQGMQIIYETKLDREGCKGALKRQTQ